MNCFEKKLSIFLIVTLIIIGCSSENGGNITGNDDKLVKITIAFIVGFDDEVQVIFNDELIFWAFISGVASFSGPEAEFTTFLPKGKNSLDIKWRYSGDDRIETIEFELEDADEFFIGLTFSNKTDKLSFRLYKGRPGYL